MDANRIVTLYGREEMLRRLQQKPTTNQAHLQERLYPLLLKEAGREIAVAGIPVMITLAFSDYLQGMSPQMEAPLFMSAGDFVDAMTPDAEAAAAAKALLAV